jgi:hypothetical protein
MASLFSHKIFPFFSFSHKKLAFSSPTPKFSVKVKPMFGVGVNLN